MPRVFIIRKKPFVTILLFALAAVSLIMYFNTDYAIPASGELTGGEWIIHMVTGEFKTVTKDGKEIETYRWDPGTVFVNKGETVKLRISGINGDSHPFVIEGLNIKGEVKKGEVTEVQFTAEKEGIYRLICMLHPDTENSGPMIGYIVVD